MTTPRFIVGLLLIILWGFICSGCAGLQALEGISAPSQAQMNQVKQKVADIDLALAKLKAYTESLPEGSATRRQQEQLIDTLQQAKGVQEAWLKAQESGDTSDLAKLVSQLPYVGGWGGFAITLLGFVVQKKRNSDLVEQAGQIVKSVDVAFPSKTDMQKTAMAAIQDAATKRLVSTLKGE